MKRIVSLLLSLMLVAMVGTAMADTVNAGVVKPGDELTITIHLTAASGLVAQIGINADGVPVQFVDATGGSVNDTIPPNSDAGSGLKGYFVVVNMPNVTLDRYGNPSGTDSTVANLVTGVVGTLKIRVNENAAPGTYTVSTQDVLGGCTAEGSVTFTVAAASGDRVPGDVNEDGKVNSVDAQLTMKYAAKWAVTINTSNADVNADGKVNSADAQLIMKYAAKWNVVLK